MNVLRTKIMTLADYCADENVSQDYVKGQLGITQQAISRMLRRDSVIIVNVNPVTNTVIGWSETRSPGQAGRSK